jgi:hypothetical protein
MWDFNVMLISLTHTKPNSDQTLVGLDVNEAPNAAAKDDALKTDELKMMNQKEQLGNPDARVVIGDQNKLDLLEKYAFSFKGITTGDDLNYKRGFWEIPRLIEGWSFFQSTTEKTTEYGGMSFIIWFERMTNPIKPGVFLRALDTQGKSGVIVSQMSALPISIFGKTKFDTNAGAIIPKKHEHLPAIWCFCSSPQFNEEVRRIDQALKVTNATLVKIPFHYDHWKKIASEKYPNGLPLPYSNDPTQWLYHGNPKVCNTPLQVAIGRLLGYRWPAESDPEMELDDGARYHIQEVQAFDHLSDEDGIFCIPSVNGEAAGADRLRDYIQAVWGEAYAINTLNQLLEKEDATSKKLENWMRDEFFTQHCKVFNNRPFIWQIWDGRKDGFSVLVNYHKLTKNNLSKLIYTYLGDWIRMCESKKRSRESGADGMLSAALKLKESLELILEGEKPFDIFVRWKPLSEQSIGWDPDSNDGVRLNIRPFVEANILRKKFNVKWGTDRGKNTPGSHWGEERDNDVHLSLEEKRRAR